MLLTFFFCVFCKKDSLRYIVEYYAADANQPNTKNCKEGSWWGRRRTSFLCSSCAQHPTLSTSWGSLVGFLFLFFCSFFSAGRGGGWGGVVLVLENCMLELYMEALIR
jgi:hypothetical protein